MKKVIYISFSRLIDRYLHDYYIDYLIEKGVVLEYWDIVALVREEHVTAGMIAPKYLRNLRTFSEFEKMLVLPENRDASYVLLISCGAQFTKVFQLLSKHNCRMIYIAEGARPVLASSFCKKVLSHLGNPSRFFKIIYGRAKVFLLRKLKLIKPYDIVFVAGTIMMRSHKYTKESVPINTPDYDNYIRTKSEVKRIVNYRYAVYLDTYLPFHNDNDILCRAKLNSENYFNSMNRFFDLLEMEYNLRVVIAAHPTAEYSTETFNGREIYRLSTAELVPNAVFVIADVSTSISYAVLNCKPLIYIYTNDMLSLYKDNEIMRGIYAGSDYLDSNRYNINEITDGKQIVIRNVNIKQYENYKYSFLTSLRSENTPSEGIFFQKISSF